MRRRATVIATMALLLATGACGGKTVSTGSGADAARQHRQAIIDDVTALWPTFEAGATTAAASGQYAQCDDDGATYGYQAGGAIRSADVRQPEARVQRVATALQSRGWQQSLRGPDSQVLLRAEKDGARFVFRGDGDSLTLTGYSACAKVSQTESDVLQAENVGGAAELRLEGVPTALPSETP